MSTKEEGDDWEWRASEMIDSFGTAIVSDLLDRTPCGYAEVKLFTQAESALAYDLFDMASNWGDVWKHDIDTPRSYSITSMKVRCSKPNHPELGFLRWNDDLGVVPTRVRGASIYGEWHHDSEDMEGIRMLVEKFDSMAATFGPIDRNQFIDALGPMFIEWLSLGDVQWRYGGIDSGTPYVRFCCPHCSPIHQVQWSANDPILIGVAKFMAQRYAKGQSVSLRELRRLDGRIRAARR